MKPRDFTLNNLIQLPFTASKINDIAGGLRSVGLFPKGGKHDHYTHVRVNEAALFLYLLASDTPVKFLKENIDMLVHLRDENGEHFYDLLTNCLRSPKALVKIESIEVGNQLRFAVVKYTNGKQIKYSEGTFPSHLIQKTCRMPFDFLADYCIDLYKSDYSRTYGIDKKEVLEQTFAQAPKEIFEDKPTIKHLKEILKDWENVIEQ